MGGHSVKTFVVLTALAALLSVTACSSLSPGQSADVTLCRNYANRFHHKTSASNHRIAEQVLKGGASL
jgi:hypothetical protein